MARLDRAWGGGRCPCPWLLSPRAFSCQELSGPFQLKPFCDSVIPIFTKIWVFLTFQHFHILYWKCPEMLEEIQIVLWHCRTHLEQMAFPPWPHWDRDSPALGMPFLSRPLVLLSGNVFGNDFPNPNQGFFPKLLR